LAVHRLSGGKRVVERLGPDDGEIAFSGIFSGRNAEARVRAFDSLRLSGELVWLTWESFRRRVVVKSFVANYHSPWWIPYNVSCVVAHQTGVAPAEPSSVMAAISADLGNALSALAGSPISLTSMQSALVARSALTIGTSRQAQAVTTVGATLNAIDCEISQQSALIIAPVPQNTEPRDFSQAFASTVSSAGLLSAVVNARSYVGRIGRSLNGPGN
jgi:hypothetical protein